MLYRSRRCRAGSVQARSIEAAQSGGRPKVLAGPEIGRSCAGPRVQGEPRGEVL